MNRRNGILSLVVIALVICLDQGSKQVLVAYFAQTPGAIPIFPFFDLTLAWNRGVSFSFLQADSVFAVWGLVGMSALFITVLTYFLCRAETLLLSVGFSFILGGAIGNLIDRIYYGAVVDFLHIYAHGYHFPIFNLADSAISLGAFLVIMDQFVFSPPSRK